MVARRFRKIHSLHVDETDNEDHAWVVGHVNRALNGAGTAVITWCGPSEKVRQPWPWCRRWDGYVAKIHLDNSTAACTLQGKASATSGMQDVVQNHGCWHKPRNVEGCPEVHQQQDDRSQLWRVDDTVREGHGEIGHVHTVGRSEGKADARKSLLHRQSKVTLKVQAGQNLAEAKVACGCRPCVRWHGSTRKSLSSADAEFYVLNLGCGVIGGHRKQGFLDGQKRTTFDAHSCDARTQHSSLLILWSLQGWRTLCFWVCSMTDKLNEVNASDAFYISLDSFDDPWPLVQKVQWERRRAWRELHDDIREDDQRKDNQYKMRRKPDSSYHIRRSWEKIIDPAWHDLLCAQRKGDEWKKKNDKGKKHWSRSVARNVSETVGRNGKEWTNGHTWNRRR